MAALAPQVAAPAGTGFLKADDKLHLLEGLCRVVSEMDVAVAAAGGGAAAALAARGAALDTMVTPIGVALQQQVAAAVAAGAEGGAGSDAAAVEVAAVLKRLAKVRACGRAGVLDATVPSRLPACATMDVIRTDFTTLTCAI